jgi:hypothetical protein
MCRICGFLPAPEKTTSSISVSRKAQNFCVPSWNTHSFDESEDEEKDETELYTHVHTHREHHQLAVE